MKYRPYSFLIYAMPALLAFLGTLQWTGVAFASGGSPACRLTHHYQTIPDENGNPVVSVSISCVPQTCAGTCTMVGGPPAHPAPGTGGQFSCACAGQPIVTPCKIKTSWLAIDDGQGGVEVIVITLDECPQQTCTLATCTLETEVIIGPAGFEDHYCECQ